MLKSKRARFKTMLQAAGLVEASASTLDDVEAQVFQSCKTYYTESLYETLGAQLLVCLSTMHVVVSAQVVLDVLATLNAHPPASQPEDVHGFLLPSEEQVETENKRLMMQTYGPDENAEYDVVCPHPHCGAVVTKYRNAQKRRGDEAQTTTFYCPKGHKV